MPKTHSSQPFIKWVAVAAVLVILSACGGGSSNPPPSNPTPTPTPTPTPMPDTTPDLFSFTSVMGAEKGALIFSGVVAITGIDAATPVTIENGEYAVGNSEFTSVEGAVNNGDQITVRTTSSSQFSDSVEVILTVGGTEGTFTVTTLAQDITPDEFNFVDQTDVGLNTVVDSAPVTIQGINDLALVSVSGGEYSVESGDFTSEPGTVAQGESVVVRATSAGSVSTTVEVILTVGSMSDAFLLTTKADVTPPEMEVHFPTPVSLTEGDSIVVRGIASDNSGEVTNISINGNVATLSEFGDAYIWQVQVDLVAGENAIEVSATDASGNRNAETMAIVTRSDLSQSFPIEDMPIEGIGELEFGASKEQILAIDGFANKIYSFDTMTGLVEVVVDSSSFYYMTGMAVAGDEARAFVVGENVGINEVNLLTDEELPFNYGPVDPNAVIPWAEYQTNDAVADKSPSLILADMYSLELLEVDVATGAAIVVSGTNTPDSVDMWSALRSLELIESYGKILISDNVNNTITAVDKITGERQIISSSTIPDGDIPLVNPKGISIAESGEFAYIVDGIDEEAAIISISLEDETLGEKAWISTNSMPNSYNQLANPSSIVTDEDKRVAYVTDAGSDADFDIYYAGPYHKIFVVDLVTGHRVILTKAAD